jgi:hypothetical protein
MQDHEAWDAFPDPWEDDHTIEYWVWRGDCLVPTTPDEIARIQEDERTRGALRLLRQLCARARREARSVKRWPATMKSLLVGSLPPVLAWLQAMRLRRRGAHEEGTHAERPVAR